LGKRLRYAMEVFADCFAPAFRDQLYPAVEEMQEILGNANDSHVARMWLGKLAGRFKALLPKKWKRYGPGLEGLLEHHQARLVQEQRRFLDWWAQWGQAGGEAAFFSLLKNPDDAEVEPAMPHCALPAPVDSTPDIRRDKRPNP